MRHKLKKGPKAFSEHTLKGLWCALDNDNSNEPHGVCCVEGGFCFNIFKQRNYAIFWAPLSALTGAEIETVLVGNETFCTRCCYKTSSSRWCWRCASWWGASSAACTSSCTCKSAKRAQSSVSSASAEARAHASVPSRKDPGKRLGVPGAQLRTGATQAGWIAGKLTHAHTRTA